MSKVDDDTRIIQSAKTRIEKFGPIKLKFEKEEKKIVGISYQGSEKEIIGEAVKTILTEASHPMELTDVQLGLEERGVEITDQTLRRMLPDIESIGIQKKKRGKTRFLAYSIEARA